MKRSSLLFFILAMVICLVVGCSKTSTPEGTVKAFLEEVNKGNTESAKVYFSGQYSGGYDEFDKKKLEEIFPAGSIKDVTFSNVKIVGESANLTITVIKTNRSPYTTNLSMVKKGGEWKINYDGWNWPFSVK